MHQNDLCYMRRGKRISALKKKDYPALNPVNSRGDGHEHALLLLHGFSSSPATFRYMMPLITGYDAILCPVLPGHVQSIAAFSRATAQDWISSSMEIGKSLCAQYNKVDILGLSLGGLLAVKLSQELPCNRLFLLAPALKLHTNLSRTIALATCLQWLGFKEIRNLAGNILNDAHAEIVYRRLPIPVILEILRCIQAHAWVAPTCPVDLFLGAQDAVVDSQKVQALFASCAQVQTHWLEHSAHVLALDNDMQKIVDCMRETH